ncbi:hypothetical protein BC962_2047 [Gillisia mitskevichiae]|uniref:Uncharacterized protein n=1 Tax=Gillisia mitskevichiae TaxID=270921 RepID=A0A495PTB0_9FLAO|nr:hypothetical protein [Gillisia mitskevichiae]RKS53791.1 hypothetical protein BC962_2047 [Gillisia mitskevichiae]
MKRILISQNEKNNGTDYVIVNGQLVKDEDLCLHHYRELRISDTWKQDYKDDFLELKSNKNNLLLKSHYIDKDNVNRSIYYTYMIENEDNFDVVLSNLEKDSQVINRKIDRERTIDVIKNIKQNNKLKSKINKILILLFAVGIAYIIINSLKQ